MVEQSAVPSLCHILPGPWSLSKCRCHNVLKWMDTQPICPRFLIRQECAFQISWTWPFSSVTTMFLHLASLEEGKCYNLGLFLWVDISLAVGPMSCSPNENAKALTKRLLAAPLAYSSRCLWKQNSAAGLPMTPAIDTGLKGIGWDFRTACKPLSGKERGVCICCRALASSFSLEEVRSSPTQPSTSLGCETGPEVLLALREISAMTEFLDRVQPELNLRRGAQG